MESHHPTTVIPQIKVVPIVIIAIIMDSEIIVTTMKTLIVGIRIKISTKHNIIKKSLKA